MGLSEKKRVFFNTQRNYKWLLLSLFAPMIIMTCIIMINGVYPFGNKMFLYSDARHQYYPFMIEYREKLLTGQSLWYSWKLGLGSNFWALLAYYCASPLNLLTVLVPENGMLLFYEFLNILKLGLAGFFCALFLKKVFGRNDISLTAFGSMYALCGFAAGFFWNIMWLDSFALLPVVMLGTWALVKEGKLHLYVIALFLSLWCCYLIGLYVCIFVFFSFFAICFCMKLTWKQMFERLCKIALASAIAIAMTAVLLLPAYLSLMQTTRAGISEDPFWKVSASFLEIFGGLGTGIVPTHMKGAPNVYTSVAAALLIVVYLCSSKISMRQKLCTAGMLLLLVFSVHWEGLEKLWNMMRSTKMLPARFTFLFSFVLTVAGFQVLPQVLEGRRKDLLLMAGTGLLLLTVMFFVKGERATVITAAVLMAYAAALLMMKKNILPNLLPWCLGLVLVLELAVPMFLCVDQITKNTEMDFPADQREISLMLEMAEAEEAGDFYRVGLIPYEITNDPVLYRFKGASMFSSTVEKQMLRHMFMMGLTAASGKNSYLYTDLNSPLTNAMLGIDYVIFNGQDAVNDGYLQLVSKEGAVSLCRNTTALSLGFMGQSTMTELTEELFDPFARQNNIFTSVTGVEKPLYTSLELQQVQLENLTAEQYDVGRYGCTLQQDAEEGTIQCAYEMPRDGMAYAYVLCHYKAGRYRINDREYSAAASYHIICLGEMKQGEEISISWTQRDESDNIMVYAAVMDKETFDEGWKTLADEQLQVEYFDDTYIKGSIEVKEDGYFCTSVPYEEGWTLYVDGEPRQITPYQDALIALDDLEAGSHTVELRYIPAGFVTGAWISGAALAAFLAICALQRKKKQ